ncbi:hypothetical protein CEXT_492011 [Caerostris extrusa]|uniref:Uncharacterized protein n=1 Tax=Caerostris extrusa TaxID=172846 RepID=A0AAV4N8K3_CAEEX|nr:hypothetical protein CEXT_492011 [Caerostris extrusa]
MEVNRPFTKFPGREGKTGKKIPAVLSAAHGFQGDNFQECLALSSIQDHLGFLEFIPLVAPESSPVCSAKSDACLSGNSPE